MRCRGARPRVGRLHAVVSHLDQVPVQGRTHGGLGQLAGLALKEDAVLLAGQGCKCIVVEPGGNDHLAEELLDVVGLATLSITDAAKNATAAIKDAITNRANPALETFAGQIQNLTSDGEIMANLNKTQDRMFQLLINDVAFEYQVEKKTIQILQFLF